MSSEKRNLENLLVLTHRIPLSDKTRERLRTRFSTVTYIDEGEPTDEQWASADVIYVGHSANKIPSAARIPRVKFVQLPSAGAEHILGSPFGKDSVSKHIAIISASGVHSTSIPQYFIATTLALFHHLQEQIAASYVEKRWGNRTEVLAGGTGYRQFRDQTVGFLGYGQIGREAARLVKAFGSDVIVATSSGHQSPQGGFVEPGFGDPDGSIPSAWYSTTDPSSFATFLSLSDVILLSLPSTPATTRIINAKTIAYLKPSTILVNVGRGNAIDTDALVAALDDGKIAGAVLDVTDPEPLPDGHTLFGRKNVIITPHLSGFASNYQDRVVDILIANVDRYNEGKELLNVVDRDRGY